MTFDLHHGARLRNAHCVPPKNEAAEPDLRFNRN